MAHKSIIFWAMLGLLLPFTLCPITASAKKVQQVLILANVNSGPYQQAINGFKKQLTSQLNVSYRELYLAQIDNKSVALSGAINEHEFDLIFALGSGAIELARLHTSSIPIVSTMFMTNSLPEQTGNLTGVSLLYPLSIQFEWMKKFFHGKTKVAILYNPDENEKTIQSARKVAQQTGFELLAIPVETPKQLPFALEQISTNIQLVLAIPDAIVMSPRTAQAVLLASFRNKVPLIGLSDSWVKSGALYALVPDYEDIGQQSAIQSEKLLNGGAIQHIPMEYPKKVSYTINVKIAAHMSVTISDDLRKNAKLIFE